MAVNRPNSNHSDTHLIKFSRLIGDVHGLKIGIALNNSDGRPTADCSDLLRNLPRHKLNNTYFYLLSSHENSLESFSLGPHLVSMVEHIHDEYDVAALIASLDCVITFDYTIAHFAGSTGKMIWLLVPDTPEHISQAVQFSGYYKNVTLFHRQHGESWTHVFIKISLYRLLLNLDEERPFLTDEQLIESDIRLLASNTVVQTTNDLIKLLDAPHPPFINVMIETTTVCNLRCSYCPNSTVGRPASFMDETVFSRIIDSIADYDENYNGRISPHFYGEPLLDTRLETFIRYTRQRLPASQIELFTNGELLTVSRYLTLKEAGVTTFIVSQHSPDPSPVVMTTLNTINNDYPELYCVTYVDQFHSVKKSNRGGLIEPTGPIKLSIRCNSFMELTFDVYGAAVLCCNDYLSSQSFGNIKTQSVREIWDGSAYRRTRNLLAYSYFPFSICSKCMHFNTSNGIG